MLNRQVPRVLVLAQHLGDRPKRVAAYSVQHRLQQHLVQEASLVVQQTHLDSRPPLELHLVSTCIRIIFILFGNIMGHVREALLSPCHLNKFCERRDDSSDR